MTITIYQICFFPFQLMQQTSSRSYRGGESYIKGSKRSLRLLGFKRAVQYFLWCPASKSPQRELLQYLIGVTKFVLVSLKSVQPRKVHGARFCSKFQDTERKNKDRRKCFVLELLPLRGEKKFKSLPQNRILLALRGFALTKG